MDSQDFSTTPFAQMKKKVSFTTTRVQFLEDLPQQPIAGD